MGMSDGKLVPRVLAGYLLGRKTMQDDDGAGGGIPPETSIITQDGDPVITEGGDPVVTE